MTIAIGVLTRETVIIAADSQETVTGYAKRDQSKIRGHHGRLGHIVVAGAGPAGYLDALTEQVCGAFGSIVGGRNGRMWSEPFTDNDSAHRP